MNRFMRKGVVFVVLLMLLSIVMVPTGCTDKKPVVSDSIPADSFFADTTTVDSADNVISEVPMPKAADELFDDFLFNFAANRHLQRNRIQFPLAVYRNGKAEKKIEKRQWKMEQFFMHQEYYTLILENARQTELVKDTAVGHVILEKVFFDTHTVEQFVFDRKNGEWKMTAIQYEPISKNENAGFLEFYRKFSSDEKFQIESMADEVRFTAPDPEDDFAMINGVIVPQQWPDFKPGLIPTGVIYNILYGQKYKDPNKKLFLIRGVANGLEMDLNFRKIDGRSKLVSFTS